MRKTFIQMAAGFAFAAALLSAQGRQPPTPAQMLANQISWLTTLLSLSSAQQAQANTILTAEQTSLTEQPAKV